MKLVSFIILFINFSIYSQTTDWKTLNNNEFSINYPKNWELNSSGQMGTRFIIFSQLTDKNDQFKENVNLIIQDLTGYDFDLNKYVELSENQIKTMITESNILINKRITKNKKEYQKIIYTGRQGVYDLKFIQYYWLENNKAYVLTFTAEVNEFTKFKKTSENILNSFKLKN